MKGTILEKIIEAKRTRVEAAKKKHDFRNVQAKAQPHRLLNALLERSGPKIITEFKRASPSKGVINDRLDPATTAISYEKGGASAISVLTEEDFFGGSLDDLKAVRAAVSVPILRKDFVIDEYQIYEAAAAGADAILLIASALEIVELKGLYSIAYNLNLDVLVEVHDEAELEVAAAIGSKIIGVNNRNLHTFDVSLDVSRRLAKIAPTDAVLVTESGLRTREEITELHELGYTGFLIGEALMRADDPKATMEKWV